MSFRSLKRILPSVRFVLLLALFLIFTAHVNSQSPSPEFTRREGLAAMVFLKACDKLTTAFVNFDGTGSLYRVEWWRCGPKTPDSEGEFPVHYVLITPPNKTPRAFPLTFSNSGSSEEYFINLLEVMDIAASRRQLLRITGKFYRTNQDSIQCLLERIDEQFQCSTSNERYSSAQVLRVHEKSFARKLVAYFQGR